jgi:hypothetical protein
MKVKYFADTDTLLIELRSAPVVETRDLDENTLLDLDRAGRDIFTRRSATAAMFRAAEPWLESHGYHHASAPRVANWNRTAIDRR